MGLLNQKKRVDLGQGEWAEIRPLSLASLRQLRLEVANIQSTGDAESDSEAQGFALTQRALEECLMAWSDEADITPENIGKLPYEMTFTLAAAVGLGDTERPLAIGPSSTDSSEE